MAVFDHQARDDLEVMRRPRLWPLDVLPLRRRPGPPGAEGGHETGYLERPSEGASWPEPLPTVELAGGGRVEYGSLEGVVEAGWCVD